MTNFPMARYKYGQIDALVELLMNTNKAIIMIIVTFCFTIIRISKF